MSEIPLNKFEKRDLVIKLHKEGKTYREICQIARVSPRDIKPILKTYEQQKKLETKKEANTPGNQKIKKTSLSSQAFKLFRDNKKPTEAAIELDISYKQVSKFWYQFLKLEKKFDCYEFYEVCQYDLPSLLVINNYMKRNNFFGPDIANVLREANDINNLNKTYYNLKTEVKNLEQRRMYLLDYSRSPYSLQPLPLNKPKYNYYSY